MAFKSSFLRVVGDPGDDESNFREGYDGSAWEWYANPGVVVRTVGAAPRAARHGTNFLGPFVDYREKGTSIEALGVVEIGDRPAHDLLVTLRDGFRRHYFIDAESSLILAERYAAPVHAFGQIVKTEARLEDYREVDGVLFPFRVAEYDLASGKELNHMQWGRIEANRDLPRSWFSPPEYERTPLQTFLENLYVQRADLDAVIWSLADFRRVYPEIATSSGLEFIGYQMAKMGDHETAIALLELNASENPKSANAAFGLGRAYESAGNIDQARSAFRRALEIDPEHRRARASLEGLRMPSRE